MAEFRPILIELQNKEFCTIRDGIMDDSNTFWSIAEIINKLQYGEQVTIMLFKDFNEPLNAHLVDN